VQTKTKADPVIVPHAIENILQVFKINTVSSWGVATDTSSHNTVKVFPVVIHYFDWKNGGLQSKLTEVQQQLNEAAETVALFITGTLRKEFFFYFVEYLGF
jgi:hypothetical protein